MGIRQLLGAILLLSIASSSYGAVRGERAAYLGGTAPIPVGARGTFDFGEYPWKTVTYRYKGGNFSLPRTRITVLEYGDKVGNRLGAGLALGLAVNPLLGVAVALSRKERHYLTVGYAQDDGSPGALVFELPKQSAWSTVRQFEAATMLKAEEVRAERVIAAKDAPPVPKPTPTPTPPPQPAAAAPEPVKSQPPSSGSPRREDTRVIVLPGT